MIESAQIERDEIEFQKKQQERQYNNISNGTVGVGAELAAVTAEIASIEPIIANLPEGPGKKLLEIRLTRLNYKKFNLVTRQNQYGIFALLEKDCEINCIEQELVVNTAYIVALEMRKLEL